MISNDIHQCRCFSVMFLYISFLLVFSWSPCHEIGQGVQFSFWTSSLSMNLDCKWCFPEFLKVWTPQRVPIVQKTQIVRLVLRRPTTRALENQHVVKTLRNPTVRCWIRALLYHAMHSHILWEVPSGNGWTHGFRDRDSFEMRLVLLSSLTCKQWLRWRKCLKDLQAVLELPAREESKSGFPTLMHVKHQLRPHPITWTLTLSHLGLVIPGKCLGILWLVTAIWGMEALCSHVLSAETVCLRAFLQRVTTIYKIWKHQKKRKRNHPYVILWIFPTLGEMLAERLTIFLISTGIRSLAKTGWVSPTVTNTGPRSQESPSASKSSPNWTRKRTNGGNTDQSFSSLFNFQTIRSLHSVTELCGWVARLSVEPFLGGCNFCIRLTGAAQDFETCSSFDGCDRLVVAWLQMLQAIRQDKYVQTCDWRTVKASCCFQFL